MTTLFCVVESEESSFEVVLEILQILQSGAFTLYDIVFLILVTILILGSVDFPNNSNNTCEKLELNWEGTCRYHFFWLLLYLKQECHCKRLACQALPMENKRCGKNQRKH